MLKGRLSTRNKTLPLTVFPTGEGNRLRVGTTNDRKLAVFFKNRETAENLKNLIINSEGLKEPWNSAEIEEFSINPKYLKTVGVSSDSVKKAGLGHSLPTSIFSNPNNIWVPVFLFPYNDYFKSVPYVFCTPEIYWRFPLQEEVFFVSDQKAQMVADAVSNLKDDDGKQLSLTAKVFPANELVWKK